NMFLGKVVIALFLSLYIAIRGYRKKSLDFSGAFAALFVGFVSVVGGFSWTVILLFFFFSSSALTKYKADIKRKREDGYKEGGQRNFEQVIANGFFPTFICLLFQVFSRLEVHRYLYGNFYYFNAKDYPLKTFLLVCYLCCYIANTSDTWSSEYGILSKKEPIFILTLKKTFHGVNGGVSLSGYLASLMFGSMLVGNSNEILPLFTQLAVVLSYQYPIVVLCIFSALFGTTLDSVLGAIFEYSGFDEEKKIVVKQPGPNVKTISGLSWLNGNQVNFLSGCITGLGKYLIFHFYGG
ncbi:predicted protein, partial [Naegleria gruberi]